ncbi:MAG TPA: trehalose-phosphatase [Caulobacteraceae bacterium]
MSIAATPTRALPAPPPLDLSRAALFADLDGTLAPIEATPDAVKPDGDRRRLLQALLRALGGRLAVISGRGLADLDRVLEKRVVAVAAVHGLVRRRADGEVLATAPPAKVEQAAERFRTFALGDPHLLVEDKGSAVALHYRQATSLEGACTALADLLGAELGLVIQKGDMVVELKAPGPDKGAAVRAFMAEAPFAGYTPVYLGDDLTDEPAFRVAQALGGFGALVGSRRPTAALFGLPDVHATRLWLARAVERRA